MSEWRGVPIQKAIIVRHESKGAIAITSGGVSGGLDYIERDGRYAEKSDIEREPTERDRELMREFGSCSNGLDYIAREGAFAEKGIERQEDASLWGQYGPVIREDAERAMLDAGGAYMSSLITVEREQAEALGITSKEDMQQLVRATWEKNVEQWRMIDNPSDIRWVAAFHTDADHSIHAHIYTWSARGEIERGETVSPEGTRAGKEIIYKAGYARILEERNERTNFLRDLARHEAVRQLGGRVDERNEKRVNEKAERLGYEERLSKTSDIPTERREALQKHQEQLREELLKGRGRLADNWRAKAEAREIVANLKENSPSFKRICDEMERCAGVKADAKGLGESRESTFRHAREEIIRQERAELVDRTVNSIVKMHLPSKEERERYREERGVVREADGTVRKATEEERAAWRRASRERRQRQEQERIIAQSRAGRSVVVEQNRAAERYGTSLDNVSRMGHDLTRLTRAVSHEGSRSWETASPRTQSIAMEYGRRAVQCESCQRLINRSAQEISSRTWGKDVDVVKHQLENRAVESFARSAFERAGQESSREHGRDVGADAAGRGAQVAASAVAGIGESLASLIEGATMSVGGGMGRGGGSRRNRSHERGPSMERDRDE